MNNLRFGDNARWLLLSLAGFSFAACALETEPADTMIANDEATAPAPSEEGDSMLKIEGQAVLQPSDSQSEQRASGGDISTQSYGYLYGEHQMAGGLFGASYDFVFGWEDCPWGRPREYAEAWAYNNQNGAANCSIVRWYNDGDAYDCRVVVHVGARAFTGGTCVTRVWVQ